MAVVRRCYQCHQPLPPQGAHAVTVDDDGAYRRWTPERAAFYERYGQERPALVYLCPTCDAGEARE